MRLRARGGEFGKCRIPEYLPVDMPHDEKLAPERIVLPAQINRIGHWHVAAMKRTKHPVLPVNPVRRTRQFSWRSCPQDKQTLGAAHQIGRIRLTVVELATAQVSPQTVDARFEVGTDRRRQVLRALRSAGFIRSHLLCQVIARLRQAPERPSRSTLARQDSADCTSR